MLHIQFSSLLHRTICNILLQFNVMRLAHNVIIHWCWLLLLLLVGYCQRVELLAITFLLHSTVVYHSTNQCCNNEWHSTGNNCCNGNTGGTWGRNTACVISGGCKKESPYKNAPTAFFLDRSFLYFLIWDNALLLLGCCTQLHCTHSHRPHLLPSRSEKVYRHYSMLSHASWQSPMWTIYSCSHNVRYCSWLSTDS